MSLVKDITGLLAVAGGGYLLYNYSRKQSEREQTQAKVRDIITDANKSGKSILPQVNEVITQIKKNPRLQSYTVAQYKVFADSLETFLKTNKFVDIQKIFAAMKTNEDLKLLNIYFGVRVYKLETLSSYKLETWNLNQWINNLLPIQLRDNIQKSLINRGITFKIF